MSEMNAPFAGRREFLKAAGATGTALMLPGQSAWAADPINFFAWSAGVDQVKSHISAFEKKTGLKVNYNNAPWAQYRDTMVTKFVGNAPIDMMWVSDSWLPEWADAGWLAPIDGYPELTKYNADVDDFCNQSMRYKGKQYGLTYYSDYMAFFYDEAKLKKAGISAQDLGRGGAAVVDPQAEGHRRIPADAVDGARELAHRIHVRDGLLQRRPPRGRCRQRHHAGPAEGRAQGAAMGGRCRQQAQDRVAGLRGDR
jgi:spermidine/putrescine-binding protein